ncbi:jg2740 [Pararge aegeria aegeria]|uniref:Jg2740 protein n=1 Tax=Pararge aegeria aegeria TaxID=348720 RepID=A0A8S4RCA1_9NEOP|nr:jg2740 [Pararge aegeria aegeria]
MRPPERDSGRPERRSARDWARCYLPPPEHPAPRTDLSLGADLTPAQPSDLLRRQKENWAKEIAEWYLSDGKRTRGRPFRRWEYDLTATAGSLWTKKTHDREAWKNLGEAYSIPLVCKQDNQAKPVS